MGKASKRIRALETRLSILEALLGERLVVLVDAELDETPHIPRKGRGHRGRTPCSTHPVGGWAPNAEDTPDDWA